MSDEHASAPIELLPIGRNAYAIAWSAPWGAAATIVRRFADEAVRTPVLLGGSDRSRREAPRLFHVEAGVGVAWCEDDGAYFATLGEDGLTEPPRRLVPGGRTLCLAAGRRSSSLFVEDGERVHAIEVRADGTITHAPEPLLEQRGRVVLAAARAGETSMLFAAHEGDRRLAIVDAAKGARSVVRHELPAECTALDAHGAGARAAFALTYERRPDVVEAAIVDATCKLVERRDAIVRAPGAIHAEVRVAWIEDGFHAIAREARSQRAVVVRVADRTTLFEIPRVGGAFATAYHEKRFVLAQALVLGDAPVLRLFTCDQLGAGRQTIELREPAPEEVCERRADARAERCIEELESALGSSGYRDARGARIAVPRGAGLALAAERQEIEVRPDGERFRVALTIAEESAPARGGALASLSRWMRGAPDVDAQRGAELASALAGELDRVDRDRGRLRVEILVRDLPDGPRLSEWLRRARGFSS